MKTEEDEAFDEIARKQGMWGGGFMAKRAMAADKLQEPVLDLDGHVVREPRKRVPKPKAQPAQEPVAWRWGIKKLNGGYEWRYALHKTQEDAIPLYAAPPQREWVGLTDEDKQKLAAAQFGWEDLCLAVEAKLKEKNNGT